jgi:Protein of unknown function DUF262
MANIYQDKNEALHELLERASSNAGAMVLIPDLQRPYVWTPPQVTLLIDSLIRGWPFGTLLMWKVGKDGLSKIPHRQFWQIVDRTDAAVGSTITRIDPPADYHMVLDGQQRVQSLLLALGGDNWGFKLEDRAWAEALNDRRARGRRGKYAHWSKATLCFDLDGFLSQYEAGGKSLLAVDFQRVLRWAITDPTAAGQSAWPKPKNYEEPLPKAFDAANKGKFVRLSRLWQIAKADQNLKEAHYRTAAEKQLLTEGIDPGKIASLLTPLGELLSTFRDIKLAEVTFLELKPFDETLWTEDAYNEAIVSVFTRLNTAGRTLTREEITLAWLKVGWESKSTLDKSAGECFQDLLSYLASEGLVLDIDNVVGAVSFMWAVRHNTGKLLATRDLLRGPVIQPMASALSRQWQLIRNAIEASMRAVGTRGLAFGAAGQFSSLNALAVVWAWSFLALDWEASHALSVPQKDEFAKRWQASLSAALDRWLICSQWAGLWADASNTTLAGFSRQLHDDSVKIAAASKLDDVIAILDARLGAWLQALEAPAIAHVNSVDAWSRERVGVYRSLLWVWHRIEAKRWQMSSIPLRVGRAAATLEVDHCTSVSRWSTMIAKGLPTGMTQTFEAVAAINRLGNCALLEKSFNISKGSETLESFLVQVHEIKNGTVKLDDWTAAMCMTKPLLSPDRATVDEIVAAIDARDALVRADLVEFVKGNRTREDL